MSLRAKRAPSPPTPTPRTQAAPTRPAAPGTVFLLCFLCLSLFSSLSFLGGPPCLFFSISVTFPLSCSPAHFWRAELDRAVGRHSDTLGPLPSSAILPHSLLLQTYPRHGACQDGAWWCTPASFLRGATARCRCPGPTAGLPPTDPGPPAMAAGASLPRTSCPCVLGSPVLPAER